MICTKYNNPLHITVMMCPLGQIGMRPESSPTIKAIARPKDAGTGQRTVQNQKQKDKVEVFALSHNFNL